MTKEAFQLLLDLKNYRFYMEHMEPELRKQYLKEVFAEGIAKLKAKGGE